MSALARLPEHVAELLRVTPFAEFATVSAQGVPIDTPLLSFADDDLSKITMATGVAYPVKAERARRNPKVGLLYYSDRPGEPMVQVIGQAAVRDRDLQQNLITYLSETGVVAPEIPWEIKRHAVWYWSRILIEIYPTQVLWWDDPNNLDAEPQRWDAPAGASYPASDPAPGGKPTEAPKWPQPDWRDVAASDIAAAFPAFVSVLDAQGFPRVMRAGDVRLERQGLSFTLPKAAPGARSGAASLTYFGRDTFVGQIQADGDRLRLDVERALPILPLVVNPDNTWQPPPELKQTLMDRLTGEVTRRGQPMPKVPEIQPEPTPAAKRRAERDTNGADPALFENSSRPITKEPAG